MADRFPLIANPSTSQIQELSNLDNLDLLFIQLISNYQLLTNIFIGLNTNPK